MPKQATEKPRVPRWAKDPFTQFDQKIRRLAQIVSLTIRGISSFIGWPQLVEALANLEDDLPNDVREERLARAKAEAQLAKSEVDLGFPLVHAQAVVTLWTYLEAVVRDFVSEWIRSKEGAKEVAEVSRIKISLAEYETLSEDEKHYYIFEAFERDTAAGIRSGISRFECLLAPFGLAGEVPDDMRKTIFELGQVRNALVHRAATADRILVKSCPWLGLSVGDEITVTNDQFEKYVGAVLSYAVLLIVRVGEAFGVDMSKTRQSSLEDPAEE